MIEASPNRFSETLEVIRNAHGMNRLEFAKAIDFDRAGYYAILKGKRPGHLFVRNVLKLAALSETDRKNLLQSYLQLHLESLDPKCGFKVQLRKPPQ